MAVSERKKIFSITSGVLYAWGMMLYPELMVVMISASTTLFTVLSLLLKRTIASRV